MIIHPACFALFVATSTSAGDGSWRIHVIEGAYTATVARALAKELPHHRIVDEAEDADLLVSLDDTEGALSLRVVDKNGSVTLTRTIALSGGAPSALRMAVLLVRNAVEMLPRPDLGDDAPPAVAATSTLTHPEAEATSPPLRLGLEGSLAFEAWSNPSTPMPMGGLGGTLTLEPLRIALRGEMMRNQLSTSDVAGEVTELLVLGEAAVAILSSDRFAVGPFAGLGIDAVLAGTIRAQEGPFKSPGTKSPIDAPLRFVTVAGGMGEIRILDRLAIVLRAGLRITPRALSFQLPAPYFLTRSPLETGVVGPSASIGVRVEIL